MKIIQIVPREGLALYTALAKKEAEIRSKGLGTFYRAAAKKPNSSKWRHRTYRGWMRSWSVGYPRSCSPKSTPLHRNRSGRCLSAFLGFIDRHFDDRILAITIHYR